LGLVAGEGDRFPTLGKFFPKVSKPIKKIAEFVKTRFDYRISPDFAGFSLER